MSQRPLTESEIYSNYCDTLHLTETARDKFKDHILKGIEFKKYVLDVRVKEFKCLIVSMIPRWVKKFIKWFSQI